MVGIGVIHLVIMAGQLQLSNVFSLEWTFVIVKILYFIFDHFSNIEEGVPLMKGLVMTENKPQQLDPKKKKVSAH